jgi:hypothetical protein
MEEARQVKKELLSFQVEIRENIEPGLYESKSKTASHVQSFSAKESHRKKKKTV